MRALALLLLVGLAACAPLRGPGLRAPEPLRLSDLAASGDAERRTSLGLVLQGLDADAEGRPDLAVSDYESALRVDATNPYAYLALARYHVTGAHPERTLPFLDKARALLAADGELSPGVEAHLVGLRGAALVATGRSVEGLALLERARELAPTVWDDGHLAADELR